MFDSLLPTLFLHGSHGSHDSHSSHDSHNSHSNSFNTQGVTGPAAASAWGSDPAEYTGASTYKASEKPATVSEENTLMDNRNAILGWFSQNSALTDSLSSRTAGTTMISYDSSDVTKLTGGILQSKTTTRSTGWIYNTAYNGKGISLTQQDYPSYSYSVKSDGNLGHLRFGASQGGFLTNTGIQDFFTSYNELAGKPRYASHGNHNSHGSHTSHSSHSNHGDHDNHDSHGSHGSHSSYQDSGYSEYGDGHDYHEYDDYWGYEDNAY